MYMCVVWAHARVYVFVWICVCIFVRMLAWFFRISIYVFAWIAFYQIFKRPYASWRCLIRSERSRKGGGGGGGLSGARERVRNQCGSEGGRKQRREGATGCICVCVCVCAFIHTYINAYMYMYICLYTNTHKYIFMYVSARPNQSCIFPSR